jgi:hypothetical protein
MPDTINSLSPDFRDALLNRNIISDTVTDNGLEGLLVGIGVPITNIGTPPEAVQPSTSILTNGEFYKDLNLITNQFQGSDDDYQLVSIVYNPNNPPNSAYIYSEGYVENSGILYDTLNTPANGPFQGGDIRSFNTSRNLYDDPEQRTLVNLNSVSLPSVKYTNYKDLNSDIISKEIDILGTLLTGGQLGIGVNGVDTNFDLRSSLIGRVLGGTGIISDTPLGQAGAKYLGLALANNAAFGLQQETLGMFNLNPLNIIKNGLGGIVVPNYDITVPSGKLGKVLDFTARVLGFESPKSLFERSSSIFATENPVSNIERANAQIANSGKGQVLALFGNIKSNKFRPGFKDDRVKGEDQNSNGTVEKGEGINPNIYAFGTVDGGIIDFLNKNQDVELDGDNRYVDSDFDVNTPISQSNYRLDGLINSSGFGDSPNNVPPSYGEDGTYVDKFIWGDDNASNAPGKRIFGDSDIFTNPNTLLGKTKNLFSTNKMRTIVSGKAEGGMNPTEVMGTVQGGTISKASGVLSPRALQGDFSVPEDVYCRVWTTFDRYNQVQDLQKNSGINKDTAYREGYTVGDSVLGENGFVKIGPYVGDDIMDAGGETNIKNFMFSIENLAWADNHESLLECEKGPGDPMTGKRGRIMWFPPYDISISENVSVNWESTNFIGRGEPLYTYNNTERSGTLSFKIVVDHPSYLNSLKGNNGQTNEYIASFFAGCTDIDAELAKKLTTVEREEIQTRNSKPSVPKKPDPITPEIDKVDFYFSNDNYDININYENGDGTGLIWTDGQKIVSIIADKFPDRNDFGLNGTSGTSSQVLLDVGNWITTAGQDKLSKILNVDCQACKVRIKGYASVHGTTGKNETLSDLRAKSIKQFFLDNKIIDAGQDIYTGSKISVDERFEVVKGEGETGTQSGCPTIKNNGKVVQNQDLYDCKKSRKVTVSLVFDDVLALKLQKKDETPFVPVEEKYRVSEKIINRFYNECNYFEMLKQEDKFVFSTLKEKLKFFHPAFHSITPEGLNSRLTFLHQCTRQGPTNVTVDVDGKRETLPDNLAFGRPPVCILRLGDFYYTKIIIDNIGMSYEPLVWDLNPEGIGVQPMIAHVDLSFKIIGGQSLKGPINRLQNAVSFNFFGNTHVYDVRADKLVKNDKPDASGKNYNLVVGETVLKTTTETVENKEKSGINGNGDLTPETNQVESANVENSIPVNPATIDDKKIISNINIASYSSVPVGGTNIGLTFEYKQSPTEPFVLNTTNNKEYVGQIYILNEVTKALSHIGSLYVGAYDSTHVKIRTNLTNKVISSDIVQFDVELTITPEQSKIVTDALDTSINTIQIKWETGSSKNSVFKRSLAN